MTRPWCSLFKPAALIQRRLLVATTIAFLVIAGRVYAAEGAEGTKKYQTNDIIFRVNVREVGVVFSALGPHNHSVPTVTAQDLVVLDEGVPVQVTSVSTAQLPIRLGVVIDASASLHNDLHREVAIAAEFASRFLRTDDTAWLMTFASKPQKLIEIAPGENVETRLAQIHAAGLTALYDSVVEACNDLSGSRRVRTVMILLSDGDDNYSYHARNQALTAAERSGAVVYTIFIHTKHSDDDGEPWMKRLSAATGGKEFKVSDPKKLESVLADIEQDIRSGYELTFRPATQISDGQFRQISIVPRERDIRIRSQAGYVAK